jgi:hypothetical protein
MFDVHIQYDITNTLSYCHHIIIIIIIIKISEKLKPKQEIYLIHKEMIIILHDKNNMNLNFQRPTQCNID